jgi:hypothetical protein
MATSSTADKVIPIVRIAVSSAINGNAHLFWRNLNRLTNSANATPTQKHLNSLTTAALTLTNHGRYLTTPPRALAHAIATQTKEWLGFPWPIDWLEYYLEYITTNGLPTWTPSRHTPGYHAWITGAGVLTLAYTVHHSDNPWHDELDHLTTVA